MKGFMPLLLELWREACRHIEIEQSLERIAPILLREIPVDVVLVRRIDLPRAGVETVACAACQDGSPPKNARSDLTPRELERLVSWCRRGEIAHGPGDELDAAVPGFLPEGLAGDVLAEAAREGQSARPEAHRKPFVGRRRRARSGLV